MLKLRQFLSGHPEAGILLASALLIIVAIPAFALIDGVLAGRLSDLHPFLLFFFFILVWLHIVVPIVLVTRRRKNSGKDQEEDG